MSLPKVVNNRSGGEIERAAPEASSLMNPAPWFTQWATGDKDGTGQVWVNEVTAMNFAAFYTCVKLIASTIATLPCRVFRRRSDGGQDEVIGHPVELLLNHEFNPNTASLVGREAEIGHMLSWGNSFTQIIRTNAGEIVQLNPLGPDIITPKVDSKGALRFHITDRETGQEIEDPLRRDEVVHVPYFTFDSMVGMSPVQVSKGLLRQGMGQDKQAERFVTKGLRAPGAIKMPNKFKTPAEAIQWRERFRQLHNSPNSDLEIIVLENGAEWQALGVNPEAAQLLQSRKFTRGELAGVYHIPPHLVGDVEKTTAWGTGIEELNIGFVVYCLLPILKRIEQERTRKLFNPRKKEDKGLFVEHILSGLLRGDSLKQSQTIRELMMLGILAINEARRILGYNPVPGGNVRFFPLNMGRIDEYGNDVSPPEVESAAEETAEMTTAPIKKKETADASSIIEPLRKMVLSGVARCVRKEGEQAIKAARKPAEFSKWVSDFYGRHAEMVQETIVPAVEAWRAVFGMNDPSDYAARHCQRSVSELLSAAQGDPNELESRVTKLVDKWHFERAADLITELPK